MSIVDRYSLLKLKTESNFKPVKKLFVISIDQIIWLFWSEFLITLPLSTFRLMPSLGTRPVSVNVTRIIVQQEVSIRVLAPPSWPSFSALMVKRNWLSKNFSHSNRDYRMKSYALRLVDSILVMENNVYYMELNFSTELCSWQRQNISWRWNFIDSQSKMVAFQKFWHWYYINTISKFIFSLPEPKTQESFSDQSLSVVCRCHRPCCCKLFSYSSSPDPLGQL